MSNARTQSTDTDTLHLSKGDRKAFVAGILSQYGEEIDICDYAEPFPHGIGYNELRFLGLGGDGEPYFESQNVHDTARGMDEYKRYNWQELTDYEKEAVAYALDNLKHWRKCNDLDA